MSTPLPLLPAIAKFRESAGMSVAEFARKHGIKSNSLRSALQAGTTTSTRVQKLLREHASTELRLVVLGESWRHTPAAHTRKAILAHAKMRKTPR